MGSRCARALRPRIVKTLTNVLKLLLKLNYRIKGGVCPVVYFCTPEVPLSGHFLGCLRRFYSIDVIKTASVVPQSLKILVTVR